MSDPSHPIDDGPAVVDADTPVGNFPGSLSLGNTPRAERHEWPSADAGFWVYDDEKEEVSLSPASARLHGIAAARGSHTPVTVSLDELRARIVRDDLPLLEASIRRVDTGKTTEGYRYRVQVADPGPGVVAIRSLPCKLPGDDAAPKLTVGLHLHDAGQDAPEQALQASEKELRTSEQNLQLALKAMEDSSYAISDWLVDEQSFWISYNWGRFLGYGDKPDTVAFWLGIIHPDDYQRFIDVRRPLLEGTKEWTEHEFRLRRADGTYTWVLLRHLTVEKKPDGRAHRIVGTLMDITSRKEAELRMSHMAEHDALTDLPNAQSFRRRLIDALGVAANRPYHSAILVCDLDRFRIVNDTRGHAVGDRLLCIVAERIVQAVRPTDLVARLGGDEFGIILAEVGEEAIGRACKRVIAAVGEPVPLQGTTFTLGISIGGAMLSGEGADADELRKRADIALFVAKEGGRNTFRLFEMAAHERVEARNNLALDMKDAIRRGEFYLVYQPVVDVSSGRVTSFEALMRWRHPVRGEVSPGEFIPIAEETGAILLLGAWALAEACKEASSWPDGIRVAVNVSTRQFDADLESAVHAALTDAALSPNRLKLEITESALIDDPGAALEVLHRLRGAGVRIALDDFGTGYSSLSYLRRFPFDKVKIDRAFIRDIADPNAAAIMRAMVGIGLRLGMGIVAEGVETLEQLEIVREEGCQEVQGFLFSRPVQADQARILLASTPPWMRKTPGAPLRMPRPGPG